MQSVKQQWLRNRVEALANVVTLPTWISYKVQVRLFGPARACANISQRAGQWTGLTGVFLRRALVKRILASSGERVSIGMGTILTKPTIELGNDVYIGNFCMVGDVRIGANTLISDHVSIISGNHAIAADQLIKDQPEIYQTLTIGEDCWVGGRAVVMANLGAHCVVGAGSVVTKPVSPYAIVAGNPAKPIGDRRTRKDAAPAGTLLLNSKVAIHRETARQPVGATRC